MLKRIKKQPFFPLNWPKPTAGWWLVAILVVAAAIRLPQLGSLPAALNRDEAALAYNAYTLVQTGKDEWQRSWPLTLESFGDYKLPGYVWTVLPLFAVGVIADWSVRLPSAVAGLAVVAATYSLARRWGWLQRNALVAASLAAVLPVLIFYSRMAWEANVGLALTLWGLWLVSPPRLKPQPHHVVAEADKIPVLTRAQLMLAGVTWLLAIFTYNTPWLLLPAVLLVIPFAWGWRHWRVWAKLVVLLVAVWLIGLAVFLPLTSQKSGVTIFTDETVWQESVAYRMSLPPMLQSTAGSKYVYWFRLMMERGIESWSPAFLVFRGGSHPWHQPPGFGHVLLPVYVLAMVGVIALVSGLILALRYHHNPIRTLPKYTLLTWLVLAVAPAVITVDAPHATRSLLLFPLLCIAAAEGIEQITVWLKKLSEKPWVVTVWLSVVFLSVLSTASYYLNSYFSQYPTQSAAILRAGYKEALVAAAQEHPDTPVAVVDPDGYQYISTAWYLKMRPAEFFATSIRQLPNQIGLKYGQQIGRYHFVAAAADRLPAEKVVISWDAQSLQWRWHYYP